MTRTTPILACENVTKRYTLAGGEFYQALNGVSLEIQQGEFVSIMGPSGSGKSTLMHIMGTLDMPTSGTYRFKGKDAKRYTSDELAGIRNSDIGFVFQSFNLLPRLTVLKNVERPMLYGQKKFADKDKRAREVLKLMKIEDKAENPANHISGGQIQRVAIARALVMDPAVILADEPTGNLDTETAREIMTFLQDLNRKGRTIIVITHDPDIARFAKRTIHIVDGRIKG